MAFVISCILLAAALPYAFLALSGAPSRSQRGRWGLGYDNRNPRESQAEFEGWRKRAHYAQLNGHEAFAPFALGLLCAKLAGVSETILQSLGVAFLLARVLHGLFYVLDRPRLRSSVWGFGILCVLALYVEALRRSF